MLARQQTISLPSSQQPATAGSFESLPFAFILGYAELAATSRFPGSLKPIASCCMLAHCSDGRETDAGSLPGSWQDCWDLLRSLATTAMNVSRFVLYSPGQM